MLLILACAWGLLRIATWSVFGRLISSTYWPSPRINLGSSRRFTLAPTSLLTGMGGSPFSGFSGLGLSTRSKTPDLFFRLLSHSLCRLLDCVHDVLIAGAAAEVSVKRVTNLVLCRLRIP